MKLNVRRLLADEHEPLCGEAQFDFSREDFQGFAVPDPVRFAYKAVPQGNVLRLCVELDADIRAECARCLGPVERMEHITKSYDIRLEDMQEEFPELPYLPDGSLDLEELAFGEVVLETPAILICRESCDGLCSECGKPAAECGCAREPEGDPRLQVLRQLLED